MIKNLREYRRETERDRSEALRRMSVAESIAIGEALLMSAVMEAASYSRNDHPRNLAISLGIKPQHART